jgi:nucleoside-diphosphate-sugar epimerase
MQQRKRKWGVVGASGFVGRGIVAALEAAGEVVIPMPRGAEVDLTSLDVLVDANGNARRYLADRDPVADLHANVTSVYERTQALPDDALYVLASSVEVYADPSSSAACAEDADIELESLARYGFHKRLAELVVQRERSHWLVLRLAHLVGEGLSKGPFFDLVQGAPLRLHEESELQVLSTRATGEALLDLVRADARGVFNLTGTGSVPFHELLERAGRAGDAPEESALRVYRVPTARAEALTLLPRSDVVARRFVETARGG